MNRHALNDKQWARIRSLIPNRGFGRPPKIGDRAFLEAVTWRTQTGTPWRDLHERFGPWKTVYNLFLEWQKRGVWRKIFKGLSMPYDHDNITFDGTVVRAHQDASGGKGGLKKTR
jgi:transposase